MKQKKDKFEFWLAKIKQKYIGPAVQGNGSNEQLTPQKTYIFSKIGNNRFGQYALLLLGGFYLFLYSSVLIFLINPQLFYFRPWEYFDDIVYHSPGLNVVWNRPTKGDTSRHYFFKNQERWQNYVSCDEDGFRSVPVQTDKYPILVIGDCQTWGTALSDNETLPWRLSEELKIPVYNAARVPFILQNLLQHERFSETKLIIEILTGHLINQDLFADQFVIKEYQPLMKEKKNILTNASPKRYFLPFKLISFFSFSNLEFYFPHCSDAELFKQNKTPLQMSIAVDNIFKRAKALEDLGYQYIFITIPQKYSVMCSDEELKELGRTANFLTDINAQLINLGIHALSFEDIFRANRDHNLFFKTDSHINSNAIELMVSELADYIRSNQLVTLES